MWASHMHKWNHKGLQIGQPPSSQPGYKRFSLPSIQNRFLRLTVFRSSPPRSKPPIVPWSNCLPPCHFVRSCDLFTLCLKMHWCLEVIFLANLGGDGGNGKLSGKTPLILWKLKLVGRRLGGAVAHLSEKNMVSLSAKLLGTWALKPIVRKSYNNSESSAVNIYLGSPPYGEGL